MDDNWYSARINISAYPETTECQTGATHSIAQASSYVIKLLCSCCVQFQFLTYWSPAAHKINYEYTFLTKLSQEHFLNLTDNLRAHVSWSLSHALSLKIVELSTTTKTQKYQIVLTITWHCVLSRPSKARFTKPGDKNTNTFFALLICPSAHRVGPWEVISADTMTSMMTL